MTRGLDALLRQALEEMADGPEPTGLTRAAMARGRRIRSRRAATAVTAVAGLTALAVAAGTMIVKYRTEAPLAPPPPGPTTLYYSDSVTPLATLTPAETGAGFTVSPANRPTALVVNHVLAELRTRPGFTERTWRQLATGGYKITTTIDRQRQDRLEALANPATPGSVLHGQPANLRAAAAVVDPATGGVSAYYGNSSGDRADYAGWYVDAGGRRAGYGVHPPGAAFSVFVLAEGLRAGYPLESRWDSRPSVSFESRSVPVRNISRCGSRYGDASTCSLLGATIHSLHTPFYALTLAVGADKVVEMARNAGIRTMWTDNGELVDLTAVTSGADVVPTEFGIEVGLGQYGVTVLDQAAAMATLANRGHRVEPHFVTAVRGGDREVYRVPPPRIDRDGPNDLGMSGRQMDNLWYALSLATDRSRFGGRTVMTRTGVWQFRDTDSNAHATVVGFTPEAAMAVWVGSEGSEQPLRTRDGKDIFGSGLPTDILGGYLASALAGRPDVTVPKPAPVGDRRGNAEG